MYCSISICDGITAFCWLLTDIFLKWCFFNLDTDCWENILHWAEMCYYIINIKILILTSSLTHPNSIMNISDVLTKKFLKWDVDI